mgnify:CR=1 FL=1
MKIHIEYCVKWNYGPEFDRVSNQIKKIAPNAIITGNENPPRTGAFEILLNGKLIYSKFETDTFPSQVELENLIND